MSYSPVTDLIYIWPVNHAASQNDFLEAVMPITSIWTLSPDGKGGGLWTELPTTSPSHFVSQLAPLGSAWTATGTDLFSIGGTYENPTLNVAGITTYNAIENSWTNTSSKALGLTAYGSATFVPIFGSKGLVLLMAFWQMNNQTDRYGKLIDFGTIKIYDVGNKAWYEQTARGDIPSLQSSPCVVGVPAPDNSSWEM
jgi:hypothetical protein